MSIDLTGIFRLNLDNYIILKTDTDKMLAITLEHGLYKLVILDIRGIVIQIVDNNMIYSDINHDNISLLLSNLIYIYDDFKYICIGNYSNTRIVIYNAVVNNNIITSYMRTNIEPDSLRHFIGMQLKNNNEHLYYFYTDISPTQTKLYSAILRNTNFIEINNVVKNYNADYIYKLKTFFENDIIYIIAINMATINADK